MIFHHFRLALLLSADFCCITLLNLLHRPRLHSFSSLLTWNYIPIISVVSLLYTWSLSPPANFLYPYTTYKQQTTQTLSHLQSIFPWLSLSPYLKVTRDTRTVYNFSPLCSCTVHTLFVLLPSSNRTLAHTLRIVLATFILSRGLSHFIIEFSFLYCTSSQGRSAKQFFSTDNTFNCVLFIASIYNWRR